MSKFLSIIEDVTPGEVDMVGRLFDRSIISTTFSKPEQDIIEVVLKDGARVELKILSIKVEEEEDTQANQPVLSPDERNVLQTANEIGAGPVKRMFRSDPVKNVGKALGDMYNKLAVRIKNIAAKMKI